MSGHIVSLPFHRSLFAIVLIIAITACKNSTNDTRAAPDSPDATTQVRHNEQTSTSLTADKKDGTAPSSEQIGRVSVKTNIPDLGESDSPFPKGFEKLSWGMKADALKSVRPKVSPSLLSPRILSEAFSYGEPFLSATYIMNRGNGLNEVRFSFADRFNTPEAFSALRESGLLKWGPTTDNTGGSNPRSAIWRVDAAQVELRQETDHRILLIIKNPGG